MASMAAITRAIIACIPTSPSSTRDGSLSAAFCSSSPGGGGKDRISRLPDTLLSNIVSRLPIKDASRTAVLSPRWRRLRASTALVLDDSDLLPDLPGDGDRLVPIDWRALVDTVSRVLAAFPAPFRFVHLANVCNYASGRDGAALARLLRLLAAKAVQELVLSNFLNWPFECDLPAEIFQIASLRRLYLVLWDEFPDTKDLTRGAAVFPNLVELGICRTDIKSKDLDRLLQCSPVLEKLALVLNYDKPTNVRIRSRSLRCLLFWMSIAEQLAVVVAPRLERLILWHECPGANLDDEFRTTVKIGYAPELKVLGYLEPSIHVLEIANNAIVASTKPSPSTTIPSVKILALKVQFGVRKDAKMIPTFLRCFPNVETLHVMSAEADEPTGKLNFKFWQDVGPIECLQSHVKRVVFKNFRGNRSELAFLRFVVGRAQLLVRMVVVLADGDPASEEVLAAKLKPLDCSTKRASKNPNFKIWVRNGGSAWSFRIASDLSLSDPFNC